MKKLSVFLILILITSGCSSTSNKTTQADLDEAVLAYKQIVESSNSLQSIISEKLGSDLQLIKKCELISQKLKTLGDKFSESELLEEHSYIAAIRMEIQNIYEEYELLKEQTQKKIREQEPFQREK
ncbi:MAG: hypothetical protein DBX47_05555 [Clostridiales bacterium]|nr:MAG: hypothetical protein DBX47_05555 [Clostridiales bacterium]